MKPTKEQIQWFWEQCGFRSRLVWSDFADIVPRHQFKVWDYPDGSGVTQHLSVNPPIDLNNLFKYAVPFLEKKLGYKEAYKLLIRWITEIMEGKDPADSLFELIYKALGGIE